MKKNFKKPRVKFKYDLWDDILNKYFCIFYIMLVNTDPDHETLPPPPPVSETGTESLIADKISENVKDVNEKAKEALEQVGDEIIQDTIADVKDDMEEKLEQIKDKAEEKIDDLKEEIEIKHHEAIEKVEDVKEQLLDKKEEIIEKVEDKVDDLKDNPHTTSDKHSIWVTIGYYFVCSCIREHFNDKKIESEEEPLAASSKSTKN